MIALRSAGGRAPDGTRSASDGGHGEEIHA